MFIAACACEVGYNILSMEHRKLTAVTSDPGQSGSLSRVPGMRKSFSYSWDSRRLATYNGSASTNAPVTASIMNTELPGPYNEGLLIEDDDVLPTPPRLSPISERLHVSLACSPQSELVVSRLWLEFDCLGEIIAYVMIGIRLDVERWPANAAKLRTTRTAFVWLAVLYLLAHFDCVASLYVIDALLTRIESGWRLLLSGQWASSGWPRTLWVSPHVVCISLYL